MIGPQAQGAIRQMISSAQYNIVQAQNDLRVLSEVKVMNAEQHYHQGYQNGRIAELESKVESLQLLLRMCS